jgi:hypothetical protein
MKTFRNFAEEMETSLVRTINELISEGKAMQFPKPPDEHDAILRQHGYKKNGASGFASGSKRYSHHYANSNGDVVHLHGSQGQDSHSWSTGPLDGAGGRIGQGNHGGKTSKSLGAFLVKKHGS